MTEETIGEWKARKRAQGERFTHKYPQLKLDNWMDFGTKFDLVWLQPDGITQGLCFGRLECRELEFGPVDLTDEQIEAVISRRLAELTGRDLKT